MASPGRLRTAVSILLLTWAGSAWPGEWLQLDVDGFSFSGDVPERRLQMIASDLRLFRYAIGKYITTTPSGEALPVDVLAVSHETWERYLRPREGVVGIFIPGPFKGDIIVDAEYGWDQSRRIIYHEYTHYYVHNLDKFPYPPWLDEGLAMFLSTTIKKDGDLILGSLPVGGWVSTGPDWLPMARVVTVDLNSPEYRDHDGKNQFYGQSWLFTHYLLLGNPDLQKGLNSYLAQMVRGADPDAAVRASFGMTYGDLDVQLKEYFRRQRFRVRPMPAPGDLEKVKVDARPVAPADALRRMGLVALRGQPDDATRVVPVFNQLLAANPADATAMAGLARAYSLADKEEEAGRWMASAEAAPGADTTALTLCGDYFMGAAADAADEEGDAATVARARKCYERAFRADPSNYAALVGLAQADGKPTSADGAAMIAALEKGLAKYPQSEFLGFALARQYYAAGDREKALTTLRNAANSTRDPAMRRRMAELLVQLRLATPAGAAPAASP